MTRTSEYDSANRPQGSRLWPSLVLCLCAIPLSGLIAYLSFYFIVGLTLPEGAEFGREAIQGWIEQNRATFPGFLKMAVPINVALLLLAAFMAYRSRTPFLKRLGLVRSSVPLWQYAVFALGGLGANTIGAWIYYPYVSPATDRSLSSLVYSSIGGLEETLIVAYLATVCSLSEELVFRGFVLRGLLRRMKPVIAISLCSLVYFIAHTNPFFPFSALPFAVWQAIVVWRTRSVLPALVCHSIGTAGMAVILGYYPDVSVPFFESISVWPTLVGLFCIVMAVWSLSILFKKDQTAVPDRKSWA